MIVIKNSKKNFVSIGQYKILSTLKLTEDKDIFHVKDLKKPFKEFTLRILKSHQNPKQIDNEIEILNILKPYKETLNFLQMEIFSHKLLFLFDYQKGTDVQKLYQQNNNFFDTEKIKLFIKDMIIILDIYKQNNIVHQNIKPENILFDGEHYYIIGLSKAMIDEQNNQSSDVYSFIAILYFLITGSYYTNELSVSKKIDEELFNIIKDTLENKQQIDLKKLSAFTDKI